MTDWKPGDVAYGACIRGNTCVVEKAVVVRGGKIVRLDRRAMAFRCHVQVSAEDLSNSPEEAIRKLIKELEGEADAIRETLARARRRKRIALAALPNAAALVEKT